MHRALQLGILDIVELICEEVGERWNVLEFQPLSGSSHRELAAILARTSPVFLNPALNVLWRHQETIENLLRTMPDDLWSITTECVDLDDEMGDQKTELDIISGAQKSDCPRGLRVAAFLYVPRQVPHLDRSILRELGLKRLKELCELPKILGAPVNMASLSVQTDPPTNSHGASPAVPPPPLGRLQALVLTGSSEPNLMLQNQFFDMLTLPTVNHITTPQSCLPATNRLIARSQCSLDGLRVVCPPHDEYYLISSPTGLLSLRSVETSDHSIGEAVQRTMNDKGDDFPEEAGKHGHSFGGGTQRRRYILQPTTLFLFSFQFLL
ncbi:hypothetical protein C8R43DRAFT_1109421 [Mycena crocata]|nr:hypothetical protein C8R43DRAFT_1109421 [Mycena crocata]